MFESEDDLRSWVKKRVQRVWWVENKRGGTFGFPDAVVVGEDGVWFLELKLGVWANGALTIEAGPSQLVVLQQMLDVGLKAGILIGEEGAEEVYFAVPKQLERVSERAGFGARQTYRLVPEVPQKWKEWGRNDMG